MYVEILRESYFGFLTPSMEDVRVARKDGKNYLVLSPEFLAASKTLKTKPFRIGNDDVDACALLRRFEVGHDYFERIARRTRLAPILEEEHFADLEKLITDGEIFPIVSGKINVRYADVFPDVKNLSYDEAITLLEFDPSALVDTTSTDRHSIYDPRFRLAWRYVSTSLPLGHESAREESLREDIQNILAQKFAQNAETALARAIGVKQIATQIDKAVLPIGTPSGDALKYFIASHLVQEPWYLHVNIARYKQMLEQISRGEFNQFSLEALGRARDMEIKLFS